jgi:hypothetical protein
MTDQIEEWRKEFEQLTGATRHPTDGGYYSNELEAMWEGFMIAKRAQPVIELPRGHLMTDPDGMGSGRYLMIETVERALQRAGVNYKFLER